MNHSLIYLLLMLHCSQAKSYHRKNSESIKRKTKPTEGAFKEPFETAEITKMLCNEPTIDEAITAHNKCVLVRKAAHRVD